MGRGELNSGDAVYIQIKYLADEASRRYENASSTPEMGNNMYLGD